MKIQRNVNLSQHCTIGIGGNAAYFTVINSEDELVQVVDFASNSGLKIHILGDGSNTIFTDQGFNGLIIKNEILGFSLSDSGELTIGAGENWDSVVGRSVKQNWSGIEALSLIPGTVGAAPVQNIGAYGQELSDTFVSLKAYDIRERQFTLLSKLNCEFSYRSSMLKKNPERYIVTGITLQLTKEEMSPPFYTTLQKYLEFNQITDYSPQSIRNAVVNWRSNYLPKIPDVKTAGSFFTNPIVDKAILETITEKNPEIADWQNQWYWPHGDKFKIAAGRLAEHAGLKDWDDKETGFATWENSGLVIVNKSANSYEQLANFRTKYLEKIENTYGLTFDQEPVEVI